MNLLKHRIYTNFMNTHWTLRRIILVVCTLLLILFVAYPMGLLGIKSLPFSNYLTQLQSQQSFLAVRNTLYIAIGSTLIATLIGVTLAFLVTRTDLPCKRLIKSGVYLIFLTPGYISTLAWIQLLGRSGYITQWIQSQFNYQGVPIDIYTLEAVIVIMGLSQMPLIFMAASNALNKNDPALEEAATTSGATSLQTIFTVTLPMVFPSVLSTALLVFIHGVSGFGIPAALAMPSGNMVLTTQIYTSLAHYDVRSACALSVMLVVFLCLIMILYKRLLRNKRYTLNTTHNAQRCQIAFNGWGYPITSIILIFFFIAALLPMLSIFGTSFLKAWGLPIALENLSFGNYISIFTEGLGARALRNSFLFSFISASCAVLLGFFIAYISARPHASRLKGVEFLATIPSAIPGPVLAAAMIFAWSTPPLKLYNTPWIIPVAYIVAFLPYAVRHISGAIKALNPQLEEMGWMCGGAWIRTLQDIVVPSVQGSLWSGWVTVFLMAFRELPLSTMLYASGTETVGVLLFVLKTEAGGPEVTSAVSVVVMALTIIGQISTKRLINIKRK